MESVRAANGLFIANNAGGSKVVPVGTHYRDNAIVAWGRVTATGLLDSDFNIASATHDSTGVYTIVLASPVQSGFSLMANVTPEVDPDGLGEPPLGAANGRVAVVNMVAAGTNFNVYMYNGTWGLVDNDFVFIVTGR